MKKKIVSRNIFSLELLLKAVLFTNQTALNFYFYLLFMKKLFCYSGKLIKKKKVFFSELSSPKDVSNDLRRYIQKYTTRITYFKCQVFGKEDFLLSGSKKRQHSTAGSCNLS